MPHAGCLWTNCSNAKRVWPAAVLRAVFLIGLFKGLHHVHPLRVALILPPKGTTRHVFRDFLG